MTKVTKKLFTFILAAITALSAAVGIILTTPQTARADDIIDSSTWEKRELVAGDNLFGKYLVNNCETPEQVASISFTDGGDLECSLRDTKYYDLSAADYIGTPYAVDITFNGESLSVFDFTQSYELYDSLEEAENIILTAENFEVSSTTKTFYVLAPVEEPETVLRWYYLSDVETPDHSKYTTEEAFTAQTNVVNKWIRMYVGLTNSIHLGGVKIWMINNKSITDTYQLVYLAEDFSESYYFALPTVVTDEYIDVYIPSGTFTNEDGYEITIPEELYCDDGIWYDEYDTHVKVLSETADEDKPAVDLDGVGDWINEKADGVAEWLGTTAGITISGTTVIVIVVGVILLRALFKKRK